MWLRVGLAWHLSCASPAPLLHLSCTSPAPLPTSPAPLPHLSSCTSPDLSCTSPAPLLRPSWPLLHLSSPLLHPSCTSPDPCSGSLCFKFPERIQMLQWWLHTPLLLLKIPKSPSSLRLVLSKGFNRAQLSHALPPSAGWSCAKHAFVSKTAPDVQAKYISEILSRTPP